MVFLWDLKDGTYLIDEDPSSCEDLEFRVFESYSEAFEFVERLITFRDFIESQFVKLENS